MFGHVQLPPPLQVAPVPTVLAHLVKQLPQFAESLLKLAQ